MGHFYEVEMEFTPEQLDFINHLVDTTTATFNDVVVFLIKLGLETDQKWQDALIRDFEGEEE